ncbi:hypothetical protein [Campylobacter iguaniorum]|nr:hypothetical protein [Campylobacter iguaniorum]
MKFSLLNVFEIVILILVIYFWFFSGFFDGGLSIQAEREASWNY